MCERKGGARRRVPYQILLSDDGYTYARVAEYLSGHLRIRGREYALKVRSASRNDPFYGPNANTVFLIDLDGDGKCAESATMTTDAGPTAAEQVFPRMPFRLAGNAFEVTDVDSIGTRLVLRPSTVRVAAVENFKAPTLAAKTLTDSASRLSAQGGKVVLIEFWSVSCGFSEKVRPAVNDLAAAVRGKPFTWVAMARENDASEVRRLLVEHRMDATVTVIDSTAWNGYDPMGATPLFVVVDRNGIVRLRAVGACAIDVVAARVKALLSATVTRPPRLAPTHRRDGRAPY